MIIQDYFGRNVRLTEERLQHLLDRHPEIEAATISVIIETLENPEEIVASNSDETVELFYRYYLRTSVGDKWMCVVVKNLDANPFVITAYFTDKIKKGALLWKKM